MITAGLLRLGLQLAEKIQAALFRHFDIQQQQVGIFLRHHLPRGGDAFGLQDAIPAFQCAPHAVAGRAIVIDNQDGWRCLFRG